MYDIVDHPIDVAAVEAAVAHATAGAIVTFIGTTRDHNDGRRVTRLEYEAYPEMALAELRKIGDTAKQRWSIERVAIVHRIGVVPIGEASVVIAVSAGHRRAAFEACHFAIDRLKEVVPIWKKEHFEGGEVWIGSQTGRPFAAPPAVAEAPVAYASSLSQVRLVDHELRAVRDFVTRVRRLGGEHVLAMKLFGSKARGTSEPESDIDILVVVDHADVALEDAILGAAFDVNLACDVYISPRVIERAAFDDPVRSATLFIRTLEKEGVAL